jgi:hypothetical protein
MITRRAEWRGDLFAADLPLLAESLGNFPVIPRPFKHTLTIFLHPEGHPWDMDDNIRMRAYCNLPAISTEAVAALLEVGITGKLQTKVEGNVRALGEVTLRREPETGKLRARYRDRIFDARSLRVSERRHHSFADFGTDAEARRITVDLDRQLFALDEIGRLALLGQLGPRIEIKGPNLAMVERMRRSIDPHGLLKLRPNRSLELLFQAMLRRLVTPAPRGFPEMEIKFDLRGGISGSDPDALIPGLDGATLLLPAPHHIHRMRRYHICSDALSSDECTIVETPSGRLSEKRKRATRMAGAVMLRDTIASRTTDLDGAVTPIERFLSERSWVRLATFEKRQTKIPFGMPGGQAYLLSLDHCLSTDGVALDQLEIEYIGTIGSASPDVDAITRELEALCVQLLSGALGHRLAPGGSSKHRFFAQSAEVSQELRRITA